MGLLAAFILMPSLEIIYIKIEILCFIFKAIATPKSLKKYIPFFEDMNSSVDYLQEKKVSACNNPKKQTNVQLHANGIAVNI